MRFLLLLLTLIISSTAFSADPDNAKGKGIIKGVVIDSIANQPLEFTTVTLLTPDSAVVTGGLTNAEGAFEFNNLEYGSYIFRVDFIGYESMYQDLTLSSSNKTIDLGNIYMISAGMEELVVTGDKSAYRIEIDKKVYDPSQNPVNDGGTGLDVLRNMPSIEIDADENISLRGNDNVNILIDGRPIAMSVSQFLKTIPSNMILEVEVITNPSAKYDPEGTAGIINIKLKKNQNKGFNGNLNLSAGYGQYPKGMSSLSLNYMTDKLNISGTLSGSYMKFGYGGSMERNIYGDTVYTLQSTDEGYRSNTTPSANVGIDYFASESSTLYLTGGGSYTENNGHQEINYQFLENNEQYQSSYREGNVSNTNFNYNVNGGWQKKFRKDGHTFDLDSRYSVSEAPSYEVLEQSFYDPSGGPFGNMSRQNVDNTNNTELLNVRADYVNPLKDSLKLEFGTHFTGKYITQGIYSETYDYNSDAFEPDTSINNNFEYSQNVLATYATLGRQYKKWGIKAGLRAEQTNTQSYLVTTNERFDTSYFALFPSLHATFGTDPTKQWQVSYSRRINRPETGEVNPFTAYTDPYTLQTGNPGLRPEFIHVIEASQSLIREKFTLNSTLYYRYINDQKTRYVELLDNGVSLVNHTNIGSSDIKGAEVIAGYNKGIFRTTLTLNYWHNTVYEQSFTASTLQNNQGYSANLSVMGRFKGGLSAQLTGNYRGKMSLIQGTILPAGAIDIALSKRILKNRGSLSLRATDIFKTRSFNFEGNNADGFDFATNRVWESRQVWVSFNYFFGKMIRAKKHKELEDKSLSDDRVGGGM